MTKSGKFMMRTAAVLLCSASLSLVAMAQSGQTNDGPPPSGQQGPPPGGGMRGNPERRLERMTKELNLTADQQVKVKAILEDGRAQMMALRNDTSTAQDEKRGKMMGMMKAENDKILAVLDDTQKAKFTEMEEKMRQGRRGGGPGGDQPPPPPPQQ